MRKNTKYAGCIRKAVNYVVLNHGHYDRTGDAGMEILRKEFPEDFVLSNTGYVLSEKTDKNYCKTGHAVV